MTPNGGPRGNHCFDGPRFSPPWMPKAACQSKCEEISECSAYEWGREYYYNCALYIHTTVERPASLAGWTCNFWSAGQLGTQPVTRAHDYGHKGECFVKTARTTPAPTARTTPAPTARTTPAPTPAPAQKDCYCVKRSRCGKLYQEWRDLPACAEGCPANPDDADCLPTGVELEYCSEDRKMKYSCRFKISTCTQIQGAADCCPHWEDCE